MYNLLTLVISASTIILCHNKSPAISLRSTFSWKRLEVVGSLSSLVFLGSLFFGTLVEGLQTITHSGHLDVMHNPLGVFVLAGGHFFTWIAIFALIGGYSRQQNKATLRPKTQESKTQSKDSEKGVADTFRQFVYDSKYEDIFRDLAIVFSLMVTSLVVFFVDEEAHPNVVKYVDPVIAIGSIVLIIAASVPIIRRSCDILLQTIPDHLDKNGILDELREKFRREIVDIHEFHLWCLVPPATFATMHVVFKDEKTFFNVNSAMTDLIKERGVQHVTLQPEFLPQTFQTDKDDEKFSDKKIEGCLFTCKEDACLHQRCCIQSAENAPNNLS